MGSHNLSLHRTQKAGPVSSALGEAVMKKFLLNNLWWVTFILALVFLISHAFSLDKIIVDNTSIILLLLILISPFISTIKKIKFGDFEAEIDPAEVRRVKENAEAGLADRNEKDISKNPAMRSATESILSLSYSDPVLALAKLRMEIEKIVSKLHKNILKIGGSKRPIALNRMIIELMQNEMLSPEIAHPLREIVSICNRAIHGEDIRSKDVETIIETGTNLLEVLNFESKSIALGENPESTVIDQSTVDDYLQVRYRLTTIIPYAEDPPIKNVRILNQEGLDSFFEGYEQFAEFVVDLRRIDEERSQPAL